MSQAWAWLFAIRLREYKLTSPRFFLKRLEAPFVYGRVRDQLYEVDGEGMAFLEECSRGKVTDTGPRVDSEFVRYSLAEGILYRATHPQQRAAPRDAAPLPSLRYLEVHLTDRCNLRCRHCYLGEPAGRDLPLPGVEQLLEEFTELQGLVLILSGGEPLLHPFFWKLNDKLGETEFRVVLLSNGTLITPEVARRLRVDEVQVSLDGLEGSHDLIRGEGSFHRAVRGIACCLEAGIGVSVATMLNRANLQDLEGLGRLLEDWGIEEWNVDYPAAAGRWAQETDLHAGHRDASRYLDFSRGGGHYCSSGEYACGAHLAAVLADGRVVKCGFYDQPCGGKVDRDSLRACWERLPRLRLTDLDCRDCPDLAGCRGGCRYRAWLAGDPLGPDYFQCWRFGHKNRG